MTRKTLFAAVSTAALLAAAVPATSAPIDGLYGTVNTLGEGVSFGSGGAYTLASELSDELELSGSIDLSYNVSDADITIDGSSPDVVYRIVFTLEGGTFVAPTSIDLEADAGGTAEVTFQPAARTATSLTYIATVEGGTAGGTVTGFSFEDADIETTGAGGLVANATLEIIAGGLATNVDSATVTITDTAPFITGPAQWGEGTYSLIALLPDFTTLTDDDLAKDFTIPTSEDPIYLDFAGGSAALEDILESVTVTVEGRQFDEALFSIGDYEPASGSTATTAIFELAVDEILLEGDLDLEVEPNEGGPVFAAGAFTSSVSYEVDLDVFEPLADDTDIASGAIVLDGVNFVAPWVSGTGASTSVIRVGNNDDDVSGDVTVRLLNAVSVVSGVAVPFEYDGEPLNLGAIPAGGDLQITSADLVAHFGEFTRGDFQITVQSDDDNLSAKMRNSRNGQSFEQSLAPISVGVVDQEKIIYLP